MAVLPFGMWDVGEAFYNAVDLEDEEDDQYEEEAEDKISEFKIETDNANSLTSDVLVIAVGIAATTFVEMFLHLPENHAGEVVSTHEETNLSPRKPKQSCLLYKVDNKIICQCKSHVTPEDTHVWIKQLLSYIQPKQVAVLSSQPKSSFQGDLDVKNSDVDILRHLKTSSFNKHVTPSLLENGNIIGDLPAAVLSRCQVFHIPAVLYISFTESHFVDAFSLKAYQPILKDEILKEIPQVSQSVVSQRLKSFDGIGIAGNNIYI